MIKNVILDLDDTIFDFHKAEKVALLKVGPEGRPEEVPFDGEE